MARDVAGVGLFVVLAFASGAASGWFAGRGSTTPPVLTRGRQAVLAEMDREVGLSTEERAKFEKIMEQNHARFLAVKSKVEPELAAIRSDVRALLRESLDPSRRARFDEYCQKRDELRKQQDQ